MRKFAIAILLAASISGCSKINIPHFQSLKPADVCGGVPNKCQPTSSEKWTKVANLDYDGYGSILGRKFGSTIFTHMPCMTVGTASDVIVRGENNITGVLKKDGRSQFILKTEAELDQGLRDAITSLPASAAAAAKGELDKTIQTASMSKVDLRYFRVDLTTSFLDNNLENCMAGLDRGEKVITGVSVIETSGEWSRNRVAEFIAAFEASAAYLALDGSAKADWDQKSDLALSGTFEPVSYVFAAAYREK